MSGFGEFIMTSKEISFQLLRGHFYASSSGRTPENTGLSWFIVDCTIDLLIASVSKLPSFQETMI